MIFPLPLLDCLSVLFVCLHKHHPHYVIPQDVIGVRNRDNNARTTITTCIILSKKKKLMAQRHAFLVVLVDVSGSACVCLFSRFLGFVLLDRLSHARGLIAGASTTAGTAKTRKVSTIVRKQVETKRIETTTTATTTRRNCWTRKQTRKEQPAHQDQTEQLSSTSRLLFALPLSNLLLLLLLPLPSSLPSSLCLFVGTTSSLFKETLKQATANPSDQPIDTRQVHRYQSV